MHTEQGLLPIPCLCKVLVALEEGIIVTVERGMLTFKKPWPKIYIAL